MNKNENSATFRELTKEEIEKVAGAARMTGGDVLLLMGLGFISPVIPISAGIGYWANRP